MGSAAPASIGRYTLGEALASGGMATAYVGRFDGAGGFSSTVVLKRPHPHLVSDANFRAALIDEALLAARIRHPHVVPIIDVVDEAGELLLVMPFVHGVPLSALMTAARELARPVPPAIAVAVMGAVLEGLHAAHEATDDTGRPLAIVHRDVSPPNILVGSDGLARLLDFGVAKAVGRLQTTRDGRIKGKFGYMAPEQIAGGALDRRVDLFASAVVLWELVTGRRLFDSDNEATSVLRVMQQEIEPPSRIVGDLPAALDEVLAQALRRAPAERFSTARALGTALAAVVPPAPPWIVSAWVAELGGDGLRELRRKVETTMGRARPARRRGVGATPRGPRALLLGAGLLVLAGIGVGARTWRAPATTPTPALVPASPLPVPAPPSATTAPPPAAAAALVAPPAAAIVVAPPPVPPTPPAARNAVVAEPSPRARTAAHEARPARHKTAVAPLAKKKDCEVPYWIDPRGVKHYKVECL